MALKDTSTEQALPREKRINIAAFVAFSLVSYSLMYISLTAAEDILAESDIPTSVVYLCSHFPSFVVYVVLPMFSDKVPPSLMMVLTFCFNALGIILLAVFEHRNTKLVGVSLMSLGVTFTDVGFLSMTALYGEVAVKAYVAGTGLGFSLSVTYYTAMTTWLCVSMNTTLMIIMWVPLLIPIFYCLMDKKSGDESSVSSKPTSHEDVPYLPLKSAEPREENEVNQPHLRGRDKLAIAWKNMPLLISLYIGVFGKFVVMQGIVTTLAFPSAPFDPRDHYQYYIFAMMWGDNIGTTLPLVMYCLKCSDLPCLYTKHTWIFACIITASMLFLVFASWFRFLRDVWVVVAVIFFIGLNHGVLYNSTFASAANSASSAKHKAYSRAFLTAGLGLGTIGSALLGLYIEPILRDHCLHISKYPADCLTRLML